MSNARTIKRIVKGIPAIDGAGVHLVRVIGYHDVKDFDPFLMLDAFDSRNPEDYVKGFPWHPHRGIETITYLVEGDIEHGDSLGNKGSIRDGDCQWMTAGGGIIHQEMPQPSSRMLGAQLWLNLPAKDKMVPPSYGDILHQNVPVVHNGNIYVKVLAGEYVGTKGAFQGKYVDATYLDVQVPGGETFTYQTPAEDTVFIYIFKGTAQFPAEDNRQVTQKQAVLFRQGESLSITAFQDPLHFILLMGTPLKEPVAWGGPIVMNTRAELNQAFEELDNGTFIKK